MILDSLDKNIIETLTVCSDVAAVDNVKIFLIGGVVRDLLLNQQTKDIDVCLEFDAIEFANILEKQGYVQILQIQQDLKTAKVQFKNGIILDLASTREEVYPKASYLPVITNFCCPLANDIKRRDFKINTIAISLNKENFGEIIDYLDGINDLKNHKLTILHKNSFIDDPSRIIRALKYAIRLNLELDADTKMLLDTYINNLPENICYSRIISEIEQVFSLNYIQVTEKFYDWNLEKLFETKKNVNYKNLENSLNIFKIEKNWFSYFGFIFSQIEANEIKKVCEFLNLDNSQKEVLSDINQLINQPYCKNNFDIYNKFLNKDKLALAYYYANTANEDVLKFKNELSKIKLFTTGDNLIKLGLSPSKEFKIILNTLLKEKLNGNLTTKEDEIDFVKLHFYVR